MSLILDWISDTLGWSSCELPPPLKVPISGVDGAGKSSLMYTLSDGEVEHGEPWFTESALIKLPLSGRGAGRRQIHLTCWNEGMGKSARIFRRPHFKDPDALCFVIDSTANFMEERRDFFNCLEALPETHTPVLVLANKQDLSNAMPLHIIAFLLEMDRFCKGRPWRVQGISIAKEQCLAEGFAWLLKGGTTPRHTFLRCYELFRQGRAHPKRCKESTLLANICEMLPREVVLYMSEYLPEGGIAGFEFASNSI